MTQEEIRQVMLVSLPPLNVEQALRQGQVDVSVLTSIYRDVAVERGGLRLLFSDLDLFGPFTAGTYVLKTDFIARHPQAARRFVEGVGRALDWSRDTPREQVQQRFADIIARRKRNENAALVKYWRSYGVAGRRGRIEPKDFQIWIDWLVRSGELKAGQVPRASVFTNELNVPP
jgi:ABC-type nitrate/sulfonate/bicarbonate transport system substrate-binding protein